MVKQIKGHNKFFISDEGYCFKVQGIREIELPIMMVRGVPKVKFATSKISLPMLMIEYFVDLKSINYKISYKIENNRIPLKNISIKYIDEKVSIDEKNIFLYKCSEKANSNNQRVNHLHKLSSLDVLNCLKRNNFKCFYCGEQIKQKTWHLEHVIPISKGGVNAFNNIASSCNTCNLMKGSLDLKKFIKQCHNIIKHDANSKNYYLKLVKKTNNLLKIEEVDNG